MDYQEPVAHMLSNDAFSRWLGIELKEVNLGQVAVQMEVRPEMLNGFGIAHGSIYFALADSAMAFAANTHGRLAVVTDAHIQFAESVRAGDILFAEAKETARMNRKAFYDISIYSLPAKELVAKVQGGVYITSRPIPAEE
jgi:acyl-CoA thioesterase